MSVNLKDFEYLLDLHGADFSRWPGEDAAAAQRLMRDSAEARALLERARNLDGMMAAHRVGPLPDVALARVLQAPDKAARAAMTAPARSQAVARLRYGGLALAACAALVMLAQFTAGPRMAGTTAQPVTVAEADHAEVELLVMAMADSQVDAALRALSPDAVAVDQFVDDMIDAEMRSAGLIR